MPQREANDIETAIRAMHRHEFKKECGCCKHCGKTAGELGWSAPTPQSTDNSTPLARRNP